jgi:hypothetical protein
MKTISLSTVPPMSVLVASPDTWTRKSPDRVFARETQSRRAPLFRDPLTAGDLPGRQSRTSALTRSVNRTDAMTEVKIIAAHPPAPPRGRISTFRPRRTMNSGGEVVAC